MANYTRDGWAEIATLGIILPRERERAKQELLDHMEDHAEALKATGRTPWQAQQEAIEAMGDPNETAKLLRKAHQPILTRLIQIARITLIVLTAVFVLQVLLHLDDLPKLWLLGDPEEQVAATAFEMPPRDALPNWVGKIPIQSRRVVEFDRSLRMGDYTLHLLRASVNRLPERADTWVVYLLVDYEADHIWQDAPSLPHKWVARSNKQQDDSFVDFTYMPYGPQGTRRGRHCYGFLFFLFEEEPTQLTLYVPTEFDLPPLTVSLEGGEFYEKAP